MDALNAIFVSARRSLPARVLALFLALLLAVPFGCFGLSAPEKAYAQELIIAIDPGHGGGEAGAYGHGIAEEYANWLIANACMNELNTKYEGVCAVLTHDNTKVMGREERILSAKAQGAYMVVSMHCNSAENASAHGCEVWVPNNSAYNYGAYVEGYNLGKRMMQELESLGLYNRGVRTRSQDNNYYPEPGGPCDYLGINYWARVNDMCGIIVEHAFVSNYDDCWFLCGVEPCTKLGWADAHAIADYYGLKLKPGAVPEAIGPFRPEEPTPDPDPTPDPQPEVDGPHAITDKGETVYTQIEATSKEDDPAIMGSSRITVDAMVARYSRSGHSYPSNVYTQYGAASIEDFCRILWEEATAEGVRPEVVFSQSMNETGWLGFGGAVSPYQCNFAGIGAVDSGGAGADFSSYGANAVRMGLRAQVQHLKAYACTDALVNDCVDPRFNLVTRGVAPTVGGLTGRWASNPRYGELLTDIINEIIESDGTTVVGNSEYVRFSLKGVSGRPDIYVDGLPQPFRVDENGYGLVNMSALDRGAHTIVAVEYNTTSADPHAVYPVSTKLWMVSFGNGAYEVTRHYGLDNLLQYEGSSIRVTSTPGIRLITGMSQEVKGALTGDDGLYTMYLKESGTLLAWSSNVDDGDLTFDTLGVSRGKAYIRGYQDPIFREDETSSQYTNVLVGFSVEQCRADLSMRPYVILTNKYGYELVVYGATVQRSIGYIAQQNANAFEVGTSAYQFVHTIIDACQ